MAKQWICIDKFDILRPVYVIIRGTKWVGRSPQIKVSTSGSVFSRYTNLGQNGHFSLNSLENTLPEVKTLI